MSPNVDHDEYGTVINGPRTFKAIAQHLEHGGAAVIAWTDEDYTQLDLLFCLNPVPAGPLQGGLRGFNELFVSIMRIGAFGFEVANTDTAPGYYAEKLHLTGDPTVAKLGELINEIKKELKP